MPQTVTCQGLGEKRAGGGPGRPPITVPTPTRSSAQDDSPRSGEWRPGRPTPLSGPGLLFTPLAPDPIVGARGGPDPHSGPVLGRGLQSCQGHAMGILHTLHPAVLWGDMVSTGDWDPQPGAGFLPYPHTVRLPAPIQPSDITATSTSASLLSQQGWAGAYFGFWGPRTAPALPSLPFPMAPMSPFAAWRAGVSSVLSVHTRDGSAAAALL